MEFEQIPSDPCVFRNHTTGVLIGIYVDDRLIAAKNVLEIHKLKAKFAEYFNIKDPGGSKILGIRITRELSNRTIYLHQSAYNKQMLPQYDMDHEAIAPTRAPMASYNVRNGLFAT
ncbi:hypothetical protein EYZ11_012206 [Aspergillus tanneri]|uniref:Reverse transcriptase Ty1/copia-type domain-containing protein n=1 Tax=Aspergillus tanneri TaxID=1220188 RepID=A0A4S3J2Y7_9EURO|nr:hypothetical protein EYZ11_012206 [Aspergillus tanneri]